MALLIEVAALEVAANGNRAAALQALEEARELDPASATVIEALAELHVLGRNWEDLVAVVVAIADATVDVHYRSMMRHNAGIIQDVRLDLRPAARASYKLALTDDPSNIAAALSLETLCLLDQDWMELARTLLHEASLIGDPQTVRRLCERAGDLLWEKLHDAEAALGAYHQAAKAAPSESSPLRRLAGGARVDRAAGASSSTSMKESSWSRTTRWRAPICTSASPRRSGPSSAISTPPRSRMPRRSTSTRSICRHCRRSTRSSATARAGPSWRRCSCAKRRRSTIRGGAPIISSRRPSCIERRLGDRHEAVRLNERAYELYPGHRLAFFALDRLYRRAEKWPELVRLYEQQAPHTSDRALYRFLRQETARMWSERVPNSENAAAAFVDVWSIDERDIGPLFLMARVLESAEKWEPLAGALDQQTKVLRDNVDKVAVKQRLATVLEVHLERPDDALAVHERVLELDANNEMVAARDGAAASSGRPLARGHRHLDPPARALHDAQGARVAALSHRPRARAQARRARRRRRCVRAGDGGRSAARLGAARARSHLAARSAVEAAVRGARAARQGAR